MRTVSFVLICLLCTASLRAELIYGFAGQDLLLDTSTGLIWLPPSADADEIAELASFGTNLRIASFDEVAALLQSAPLYFPSGFTGARNFDPAIVEFFSFVTSGALPSATCGGIGPFDDDCYFAWAYKGPPGDSPPLDTYSFIGIALFYENLVPGPAAPIIRLGWPVTLATYPIDPCDPEFVCTSAAFRVMELEDTDGDGHLDDADNCILQYNPAQLDSNGDGIGNICDPDLDNNGIVNFADLLIIKTAFFGMDANADLNGDGVVGFVDLQIMKSMFFGPPGPSGLRSPVTYWANVQPVFSEKCATCHVLDQVGDLPDLGDDYGDTLIPATDPACSGLTVGDCSLVLIENGTMPPQAGCTNDPYLDFQNFACLVPSELETVRHWLEDGQRE